MHRITNLSVAWPSTKANFGEGGIGAEYKGGSKASEARDLRCLIWNAYYIDVSDVYTHVTRFALKESGK